MKRKKPLSKLKVRKIARNKLLQMKSADLATKEMARIDEMWESKKPVYFSSKLQDQVYRLYMTDKEKWSVGKLARYFDADRERIAAFLMIKHHQTMLKREGKKVYYRFHDRVEATFPDQFKEAIPGGVFSKFLPKERNAMSSFLIGESEVDERELLKSFIRTHYKPGDHVMPGENQGYVNEELESVIIKKGWRTPEEVEEMKQSGHKDTYIYAIGSNVHFYPTIVHEVNGTIRTATAAERVVLERARRNIPKVRALKVSLKDKINIFLEGKKKPRPLPLDPVKDSVKYITIEEFVERKRQDPDYYLKRAKERRDIKDKERNEKAMDLIRQAKEIRKKSSKGGYLRAYYEPKGILKWTPEDELPRLKRGVDHDDEEFIAENPEFFGNPTDQQQPSST